MNFAEHLLGTTSHTIFFFPFCRSFFAYQFIWWRNDKLGEGIHEPVQFGVVMEIRLQLYCQVVATHVVKEKEELKNFLKWGKFSFNVT